MLTGVFLRLLDMSKAACILILIAVIARFLFVRMPKKYSYFLWFAVFFRLLCPLKLELQYSVLPYEAPLHETYVLEGSDITASQSIDMISQSFQGTGEVGYGPAVTPAVTGDEISYTWVPSWNPYVRLGQYICLAGIIVFILYSFISYANLKKALTGSVRMEDNVMINDYIPSPFVLGLVHPQIYLPSDLSSERQPFILMHEKYHIRRKDPLWKFLSYIALGLHWFNPLVWIAFSLFQKDMEMSCDEAVINEAGEEIRAAYSAALLEMASDQRVRLSIPLAFDEGDPKSRIRNLADRHILSKAAIVLTSVLCVILSGSFIISKARTEDTVTITEITQDYNHGRTYHLALDLSGNNEPFYVIAEEYDRGTLRRFLLGEVPQKAEKVSVSLQLDTAAQNLTMKLNTDGSEPVELSFPGEVKAYGWDGPVIGEPVTINSAEDTSLFYVIISHNGQIYNHHHTLNPADIEEEEHIVLIRISRDPAETGNEETGDGEKEGEEPVAVTGDYLFRLNQDDSVILHIEEEGNLILSLEYAGEQHSAETVSGRLTDLVINTVRPYDSVLFPGSSIDGRLEEDLVLSDSATGELIFYLKADHYRLEPERNRIAFLVLGDDDTPVMDSGISFERIR